MKTFEISKKLIVDCVSENTRTGFRHLATLRRDYVVIGKEKCTYQNRTWERYEFESVLQKVAELEVLTEKEKKAFKKYLVHDQEDTGFKTIAMVAQMGEIFGKTTKEKNDWKTRMLKAGLENKGLEMPDDWESLPEATKKVRLDKVIAQLK